MLTVRAAEARDATTIASFNRENDDERGDAGFIAQQIEAIQAFERLYVADLAGTVVGMAGLRLLSTICDPRPYAELTELYVGAAYRRRGIARALLTHIEEEARRGGAGELVLLTAWQNSRAQRLYLACGFTLYTVTMRKPLHGTSAPNSALPRSYAAAEVNQ
jgi:ribosomal protein S18 acetylase RimI-like enzyme